MKCRILVPLAVATAAFLAQPLLSVLAHAQSAQASPTAKTAAQKKPGQAKKAEAKSSAKASKTEAPGRAKKAARKLPEKKSAKS
jgi:hypothetical protein